jgi:small subunit ribosomal protein S21
MVFIKVREGEGIEEALRRFKRECQRNGILKEIKRRQYYLSPSAEKKRKREEAARKRRRRKTRSGGMGRLAAPRPFPGPGEKL